MPIEEKKFATLVKVTIPIPKEEAEYLARVAYDGKMKQTQVKLHPTHNFGNTPHIEITYREG